MLPHARVPPRAVCCYSRRRKGLFAGIENGAAPMTPAPRPFHPGQMQGGHLRPIARTAIGVLALTVLAGCEQNAYVPPPPPKVEVAVALKHPVTRYLEATG